MEEREKMDECERERRQEFKGEREEMREEGKR